MNARQRFIAITILLVGLVAATATWFTAEAPAEEDPDVDFMEHSKKYERQVEVIGGKSAVFATELDDALARAWEGRNRAITVACVAALLAGAYALLCRARRLADEERGGAGAARRGPAPQAKSRR